MQFVPIVRAFDRTHEATIRHRPHRPVDRPVKEIAAGTGAPPIEKQSVGGPDDVVIEAGIPNGRWQIPEEPPE
jgi:hypothetical protein